MTRAEEDLLVLARRGDLGDDDARRLRELLATSPDARELYEAGRALDQEALVIAGDELMFARIVRDVAARHGSTRRPLRRWIARGAIAAILLAGITVGASALSRKSSTPTPAPAPAPTLAPSAPIVAPPAPHGGPSGVNQIAPAPALLPAVPDITAPPVQETAMPPPSAHASRDVGPAVVHHAGRAHAVEAAAPAPEVPVAVATPEPAAPSAPPEEVALPPPPPPEPTAGELFAAANRARVAGNTSEAIERAKDLERRYPTSKEAITTLVTLGMLYLKVGDAASALSSFDAYRASGNTAVMAEALWGKSQALHALGRATEERAALEQLVGGYPHSAYTNAAKNRLSTLK